MSEARAAILASVRGALGAATSEGAREAEYAALPREYTRAGTSSREELVARLSERLREYDAEVLTATPSGIADGIAAALRARGKSGLAMPAGVPADWLPEGFNFTQAERLSLAELDAVPGVLTSCTVAIAETGTIVLQHAPGQGARRLSLVPDYHLCVVWASQIVATVPEAFAQLAASSHLPTTFISGPSATADIEMTRIKGVHGPRTLDVLLVVDLLS